MSAWKKRSPNENLYTEASLPASCTSAIDESRRVRLKINYVFYAVWESAYVSFTTNSPFQLSSLNSSRVLNCVSNMRSNLAHFASLYLSLCIVGPIHVQSSAWKNCPLWGFKKNELFNRVRARNAFSHSIVFFLAEQVAMSSSTIFFFFSQHSLRSFVLAEHFVEFQIQFYSISRRELKEFFRIHFFFSFSFRSIRIPSDKMSHNYFSHAIRFRCFRERIFFTSFLHFVAFAWNEFLKWNIFKRYLPEWLWRFLCNTSSVSPKEPRNAFLLQRDSAKELS